MCLNELAFAQKNGFVPPAWSEKLDPAKRFELVLDDEAVLDKETGLVWERSPDQTQIVQWATAISKCLLLEPVGGRLGWRLPRVEELASLVDPTQSNPALPSGHPFNVLSNTYWSVTTAVNLFEAWAVGFSNNGAVTNGPKSGTGFVWCVRGGIGYDGQ
jgi:hypothetical protein